ncbi:DNA-binding HxlR family transcriptional regulator [Rhodococcus fascians]|uniref:winged helix-turn-helix transcriptional regulator n=1 Tax=Nocardiaceae TaxID=85025 RepID=UPI0028658411|nr:MULTISPECIES: helix-turn-helix domain-containing protein [Rhodococcus]MDR6912937.1 DNA-binding HxlR family transcriptional regulator [Rhodococcus sp. 3258]MDR6934534.1 DNA-binding HxlR family transcriptional regulator [Rhodococcus fascians]
MTAAYQCPARPVLDRIGERWTMLTLREIDRGAVRFKEIKDNLDGISAKVLSETLLRLERDGLIERAACNGRTQTITYTLTEVGGSLLVLGRTIVEWSYKYGPEIFSARRDFDEMASDVILARLPRPRSESRSVAECCGKRAYDPVA